MKQRGIMFQSRVGVPIRAHNSFEKLHNARHNAMRTHARALGEAGTAQASVPVTCAHAYVRTRAHAWSNVSGKKQEEGAKHLRLYVHKLARYRSGRDCVAITIQPLAVPEAAQLAMLWCTVA